MKKRKDINHKSASQSYYSKYEGVFKMMEGIWQFQTQQVKSLLFLNAGAAFITANCFWRDTILMIIGELCFLISCMCVSSIYFFAYRAQERYKDALKFKIDKNFKKHQELTEAGNRIKESAEFRIYLGYFFLGIGASLVAIQRIIL